MRWAAILIVVGFVLGVGFGYFLGVRVWGPDLAQREPEVAAESAEVPVVEARATAVLPGESKPPAVERSALAEALRALPRAAVEPGAGSIKGHVRLETGEPLAGVRVTAYREGGLSVDENEKARRGAVDDLDADVREFVAGVRWREAYRRESVTGDDGAYELRDLAESEFQVYAQLEGYAIERGSRRRDEKADQPGTRVDFRAQVLVKVSVGVFLPDGGIPDAARIEWESGRRGEGTSYCEWTREQAWIELSPAAYKLAAAHGNEGRFRSDPQEVLITVGQVTPGLTFQLRERPGIEGRVIVPENEEIENLVVCLKPVAKGTLPEGVKFGRGERTEGVDPGSDNRFRFPDLAPGTYAIAAGRGDGAPVVEIVDVADRTVTRDLTLPPLNPDNYVVLWVLGPNQEPLQDVFLSTETKTGWMARTDGAFEIPRPDGSYWIRHFGAAEGENEAGASDSANVKHIIRVRSKKYGEREVEYRRGQARELTVRFGELTLVDVTLKGFAGSGHEGKISLKVRPLGKNSTGAAQYSTSQGRDRGLDPTGQASIGPLDPGHHEVVLLYGGDPYDSYEIHQVPIDVRLGKNSVSIPMPRLYQLRVVFEDSQPGARISIAPSRGRLVFGAGSREVGQDGSVVFEGLAADDYQLGQFAERMKVRVPEVSEVTFRPMTINALDVTVSDPQGSFGAAGLQNGDLVISINGFEFESMLRMQGLLFASLAGKEVKLTVLRGDRKFEISLDPKALMRPDGLGGTLEPSSR